MSKKSTTPSLSRRHQPSSRSPARCSRDPHPLRFRSWARTPRRHDSGKRVCLQAAQTDTKPITAFSQQAKEHPTSTRRPKSRKKHPPHHLPSNQMTVKNLSKSFRHPTRSGSPKSLLYVLYDTGFIFVSRISSVCNPNSMLGLLLALWMVREHGRSRIF